MKLRVSGIMTSAPVILTLDTDMYSNDPQTPLRVLCYLLDPAMDPKLGYIQFPQIYHGINENDIYGGQLKLEFQIEPCGVDGLVGPNYVGTGCFFRRRVFFGGPSSETPEPNHLVNKSINSKQVLAMAHHVADCDFEKQTNSKWGIEVSLLIGYFNTRVFSVFKNRLFNFIKYFVLFYNYKELKLFMKMVMI